MAPFTGISAKHQATIPVQALKEAGLKPGDEVRVVAAGRGRLVLEVSSIACVTSGASRSRRSSAALTGDESWAQLSGRPPFSDVAQTSAVDFHWPTPERLQNVLGRAN